MNKYKREKIIFVLIVKQKTYSYLQNDFHICPCNGMNAYVRSSAFTHHLYFRRESGTKFKVYIMLAFPSQLLDYIENSTIHYQL